MHINPLNATNSRHMDLLLTCSPNNMDLLTIERPHRLKWTRNYRPLWQICGPAHQHTFIDMLTNTHTLTYTHIDMLTSTHIDMLTSIHTDMLTSIHTNMLTSTHIDMLTNTHTDMLT